MKPRLKFLLRAAFSVLFTLPVLTASAMFGVSRKNARSHIQPPPQPYKFSYRKSLHEAIVLPSTYENIYLLIRQKPDLVNQIDIVGNTPLHIAVGCKKLEIVKLLLINGADVTLKTPAGKTALDTAKSLKNNVTEQLAKKHSDPNKRSVLLKEASILDEIIKLLESYTTVETSN